MMELIQTGQFKRDIKRVRKQGKIVKRMEEVVLLLRANQPLTPARRDHALSGNWHGHRECHISPDWLLVYRITSDALELVRTGSHSDIFG